ncbi:hypothetical protein [Algibacter sp. L3A6]|uniref:hypothetical protein n=1 Tax=Algibacter sp. L3A6 TaxID=2686366 RepID=UPI00131DE166|nr:hypothetical protein [Algibacter sp. L3A6]
MKKLLFILAFIFISINTNSQSEITGQFSTEQISMVIGQQQRAEQGSWSSTINVGRSYLTVNGKKYSLYRYSEEDIKKMYLTSDAQQVQQPLAVTTKDFYLLGYQSENGKYCQIKGIIDNEKGIIYYASFIKTYNSNEIINALNKCGN